MPGSVASGTHCNIVKQFISEGKILNSQQEINIALIVFSFPYFTQ